MPTSTLSLCMIARNEADNIGRAIRSVKDFVDEIIVVDTGSTDDTPEVARLLGAKVIKEQWRNDFSAVRNTSLEHATGDWIFFLDCDEELVRKSGPELRKVIQDSRYQAYFVLVSNVTDAGVELTFPSIRLFRNRKEFRFTGQIHEQIAGAIIDTCGQTCIGNSRITILHHGYNAGTVNIQAKIQRNLAILSTYPEEKRDGFFWYNLGTEYLRLGEKQKALECYAQALKRTKPNQAFAPVLVKRTITTLMDLERYRAALEQLRHYQGVYPQFSDLVYLDGFCHVKCGRFSEAKERLQHYLGMPVPPAWYPTEAAVYQAGARELINNLDRLAVKKDCPAISVCIIGRDEAALIRSCIQSVSEIAKEVIYVDTGSRDDTPDRAHQMGASVYSLRWAYDYARARNFALNRASGDWVLVLDADEALPDRSREMIVNLIRNGYHDGYAFKVCTYLDKSLSLGNCHLKSSCRLFRRGVGRYEGAAAEDVTSAVLASGGRVATVDVTVNHYHFLADSSCIVQKREWKRETIARGLADEPRRQNYALGIEHYYARDFAWAVKCFENSLDSEERSNVPEFFFYYGRSLMEAKLYQQALPVLEQGTGLFPDYTDLFYVLANVLFLLKRTEEAECLLNRCLEMGDAPWQKYITSPGAGSFKALCLLGIVHAQKGNVSRALEIFVEAARTPEAFERAIKSLVLIKDRLSIPLPRFLEKHNLLSPQSLSVASSYLALTGKFEESLAYLKMAGDLAARQRPPRDFLSITRAIDGLLTGYLQQATRSLPAQSPLRSLLTSQGAEPR
ncbi:MAG: glycosyltransferase [Bacillota bacterium]